MNIKTCFNNALWGEIKDDVKKYSPQVCLLLREKLEVKIVTAIVMGFIPLSLSFLLSGITASLSFINALSFPHISVGVFFASLMALSILLPLVNNETLKSKLTYVFNFGGIVTGLIDALFGAMIAIPVLAKVNGESMESIYGSLANPNDTIYTLLSLFAVSVVYSVYIQFYQNKIESKNREELRIKILNDVLIEIEKIKNQKEKELN